MAFPLSDYTRQAIEHHFRRKNLQWSEPYFLDVLANSTQKHDVYWAVIALRDCGTSAAIPALKAKLTYPMKDVKCVSMLTIAHIAGAAETECYTESLLDAAYPEKGYAMWAVNDAADDRAVEGVLAYFTKNRSRLRRGELSNGTL